MKNVLKSKIVKKCKVMHVKCYLRKWFFETRDDEENTIVQPILYYTVSASDGSDRRVMTLEDAEKYYELLVDFQKRQSVIKE